MISIFILDKTSEKILKHIIKANKPISRDELLSIKTLKKLNRDETIDCIRTLREHSFVEIVNHDSLLRITFAGKSYFELKLKYDLDTIVRSITFPVMVSVLTNLVIELIKTLLK